MRANFWVRSICGFVFSVMLLIGAAAATMASAQTLSALAPPPDWSTLQPYQRTITRDEFTRLINEIYAQSGSFWPYTDINDQRLILYSDFAHQHALFTLNFAASRATEQPNPFHYQTKAISKNPLRPLKGIRIALDPGHIGGEWSKLEARYFKLGDDPAVEEAKLNMITCQLLADRLQADGAEVVWAKQGYEPTTDLRPSSLYSEAIVALTRESAARLATTPAGPAHNLTPQPITAPAPSQRKIENEAALLFYRVAEIRARADLVNRLKPDLTICIHYNADEWGDPLHPTLVAQSRLVIFLNGSYEKSELVNDDIKFNLMRKLLDRDAAAEVRGCDLVGQQLLDMLKYPPEKYVGYFARRVSAVPSVYARNLIASRLYHGPVIYCEGPYMNARDAYARIIAGDYLGLRRINGVEVPSIYREYARAVEGGVLEYFGVKST